MSKLIRMKMKKQRKDIIEDIEIQKIIMKIIIIQIILIVKYTQNIEKKIISNQF